MMACIFATELDHQANINYWKVKAKYGYCDRDERMLKELTIPEQDKRSLRQRLTSCSLGRRTFIRL